jgi:hypothetical protein
MFARLSMGDGQALLYSIFQSLLNYGFSHSFYVVLLGKRLCGSRGGHYRPGGYSRML